MFSSIVHYKFGKTNVSCVASYYIKQKKALGWVFCKLVLLDKKIFFKFKDGVFHYIRTQFPPPPSL
jgi:hypothetical protein